MNLTKIKKNQYKFFFIIPAFIMIFIFFLLPNILNFYYSFTDWTTYKSEIYFSGLKNFRELTIDGEIWEDMIITIKYAILVSIIMNIFALSLAFVLEKTTRINNFFRTVFFIPVLLSNLAAGYIFKALYDPDGPINSVLSFITGSEIHFPFLGSVNYTLIFVILVHVWKSFGFCLLVYIAGLNYIPRDLIEAAEVEGANLFGVISKIKIPLLASAFTFNLTLSLIGALSTFEIPLAVARGGPARVTEVLNIFIFRLFGVGRWGYASSVSLVLFLTVCIFAFPMIFLLKKREVEL